MPRPQTIYLARHGETDWNLQQRWQGHTDIALNETGRAQAALLADRLREHRLERVCSSDLGRARETGEIVAAALGVPFAGIDHRLRERSFGVFEGLTAAECEANHPEHWQRYRADPKQLPPGVEDPEQVAQRMLAGAWAIAAAEGTALIVSHGSSIRALVSAVTGETVAPLRNGALFRIGVHLDDARPLAKRFFDPKLL